MALGPTVRQPIMAEICGKEKLLIPSHCDIRKEEKRRGRGRKERGRNEIFTERKEITRDRMAER